MSVRRREKISAVDTAWLRMDRPSNLMMICGVLLFSGRIRFDRLTRIITGRFLKFDRFRQRPVERLGAAYWESVPHFHITDHVVRTALPAPAGTDELQALVSRLAATPLDPTRPLWQYHLVENFDGGSAVIARIHHCYADGIALVRVFMSMTDAGPKGPPAMPFEPASRRHRADPDDPVAALIRPLSGVVKLAQKAGTTLIEKGAAIWSDPAQAVALAEQGGALTAEIAKLALMPQD